MLSARWACGHVRPDGNTHAPMAQKYMASCERERGHTGDHERYGGHWLNDGSNASDIPPDKVAAQAEEIARLTQDVRDLDIDRRIYDRLIALYKRDTARLNAMADSEAEARGEIARLSDLLAESMALQAKATNEQTGFAALTDYGRGLALRVLALGPQIVGPAVPPEERKPYSAPTLTNHGTIADLTADHPDDGRP